TDHPAGTEGEGALSGDSLGVAGRAPGEVRQRSSTVAERLVLITGASRGIGRAIALAFAEPNVTLWLNYKQNEAQAEEVAAECKKKGASVKLLRFDVGDAAEVGRALEPLLE